MKRGCFITGLTVLTILIGVIFYIGKNYKDIAPKYLRSWIVQKTRDNLDKKINILQNSPEKDTLVSLVNGYMESMKDMAEWDSKRDSEFLDSLSVSLKDKKIDSTEIALLKNLFNKHITAINARH
ncbi:MAG: hypothetical protein ACM34K_06040 [Bacillota bacterium]